MNTGDMRVFVGAGTLTIAVTLLAFLMCPGSTRGELRISMTGYGPLPPPLESLAYPYRKPAKLMAGEIAGTTAIACDMWSLEDTSPESILTRVREGVESEIPSAELGWGGTFKVKGRQWAVWEMSSPSISGTLKNIVASSPVGPNMVFSMVISIPESDSTRLPESFGRILNALDPHLRLK